MHLRFIFADKALIAEDAALVEGGCDHLASQLLKIIELSGLDRQFDPPSDLHLRCPLTEIVHGYVISSEGGERIARREVVWAKGRFWKHPAGFSQGPQSALLSHRARRPRVRTVAPLQPLPRASRGASVRWEA